jgi:hypothetical protein
MDVYASIKQADEQIYQALLQTEATEPLPHLAKIDMHANPVDFTLSHLELLDSITIRGDKQRENMLLDVIQRLRRVRDLSPFAIMAPSSVGMQPLDARLQVDPKKVDVILYDLGNKYRLLDTDQYAQMKIEIMRGVKL